MWISQSMKMRLIWPFFFILIFHCIAIFLFTRGFLLTRTELPYFSNCSDISQSPCFSSMPRMDNNITFSTRTTSNQTCWTKPVVDRVVIIVLDALRFDFVAPSTFFKEKEPWMDRLPVLQNLAAEPGSSARIFKAIADPPTTSLQRLKGLTTGGLPTFIDVGNSFGAPAIVEDNLIQQLVQNGKRVVMMGDDTWMQLFPHHFEKSFPYPSFNVKDLDTVDNGCIEHLLPSLYEENWDVLIAHFLGVDHAGHIFGVNTAPMIQKLEQYNSMLQQVIEALKVQSGPGDLHENTFLLVLGDHGQTLNGDHGGGSAEEVETSIFAMSTKQLPYSIPPELDRSSCELNMDGKQICIGTIEQLDFAATISAMLGVPFPFGSIGRVNPQLYALGSGSIHVDTHGSWLHLHKWMQHYANVLCINAWQVKRYIDIYTASSVIGFPSEDFLHAADAYSQAQKNWSRVMEDLSSCKEEDCDMSLSQLKRQVDAYLAFLGSVIELARSKWTEFDIKLMIVGFSILLLSLLIQLIAMKRVNKIFGSHSAGYSQLSVGSLFAIFLVFVRACSFLSNSYILEEGKVVIFFLGTLVILQLRHSFMVKKMILEALLLLSVISLFRFVREFGPSKQAAGSVDNSWMLGITEDHPVWISLSLIVPTLALIILTYLLCKYAGSRAHLGISKCIINGTTLCYILIAAHWFLESKLIDLPHSLKHIGRIHIPQLIYAICFVQLMLIALHEVIHGRKTYDCQKELTVKVVATVSACSSTIILLSGKQGSLIAVAAVVGVRCIVRLQNLGHAVEGETLSSWSFYGLSVTQWSLLALCLFFSTGHWCAFDGLRYGAAFIGFDEFMLIRQAILLSIDTFGFSHILPIFGLPILVAHKALNGQSKKSEVSVFVQLSQVYLMIGFIATTTVLMTVLCVTIHRRHLMVWGLFAPKYVFDAVGLIITDVLICFAVLYYIDPAEDDTLHKTA